MLFFLGKVLQMLQLQGLLPQLWWQETQRRRIFKKGKSYMDWSVGVCHLLDLGV
jgi:hypothetical protein